MFFSNLFKLVKGDLLKADRVFRQINQITPALCAEFGVLGLIFDLDDTLVAEHSGIVSEEVIKTLKKLQAAKIKVGIITNNSNPAYCQAVQNICMARGLCLPIIENAYKPFLKSFRIFLDSWKLEAAQVAVVGDGILTDTLGARLSGLKCFRARWFPQSVWQNDLLLIPREVLVIACDWLRKSFLGHKSLQINFDLKGSKEVVFLYNSASGSFKLEATKLENMVSELTRSIPNTNFYSVALQDKVLLKQLCAKIFTGAVDTLVAIGGDGTVREAINLIAINWKTKLAIIPTGTGNLLAKRFKIPLDYDAALEVVLGNLTQNISVCKASSRYKTQYFAMIAGCGFDAAVMKETTSRKKKIFGPLAYLGQALLEFVRLRGHVFILKLNGITMKKRAVAITSMIGNNLIDAFIPSQASSYNSELLDIYVFKNDSTPWNLINSSINLLTANSDEDENIQHYQATEMTIKSRPNCHVQLDGDYFCKTPLKLRLYPNQLRVIVPKSFIESLQVNKAKIYDLETLDLPDLVRD